jgi:hypothetical protein
MEVRRMKAYGGRHCIFLLADSDGVVDIAVSLAAGLALAQETIRRDARWSSTGRFGLRPAGFTECLNTFGQGRAALRYDATSAASTLEDASKAAGKVGHAYAPVNETESSGWLWASTIAGKTTVDRALAEGQMLAEDVAKKGRK